MMRNAKCRITSSKGGVFLWFKLNYNRINLGVRVWKLEKKIEEIIIKDLKNTCIGKYYMIFLFRHLQIYVRFFVWFNFLFTVYLAHY